MKFFLLVVLAAFVAVCHVHATIDHGSGSDHLNPALAPVAIDPLNLPSDYNNLYDESKPAVKHPRVLAMDKKKDVVIHPLTAHERAHIQKMKKQMKELGSSAMEHVKHLAKNMQHLRDAIDEPILADHTYARDYHVKHVKVNHDIFDLKKAKTFTNEHVGKMATVHGKDIKAVNAKISMNKNNKPPSVLNNDKEEKEPTEEAKLKAELEDFSPPPPLLASPVASPAPRFEQVSMGTMDREVTCPSRVNGKSLRAAFPLTWTCVNLAQAAYQLGKVGGPVTNAEYTLLNKHKVHVTRVDMNQAGIGDIGNLGLGSLNGPFFISHDDAHIYLTFRGSYSLSDWVSDLTFNFVPLHLGGQQFGFVHKGFYTLWAKLHFAKDIKALMAQYPEKKLVVTGHSLGAALAVLASFELSLVTGKIPELYTFGQPRVGGKTFRYHFRRHVTHYRFRNKKDLVPTVPPFYSPLPTLNLIEALKPERQFRIYYHAADVSIKLLGPEEDPKYVCVIDAIGAPEIPSISDHSMDTGYNPDFKILL